jgi:hypothetical protein
MGDLTLIKKGAGLVGLDDEIALLEALAAIAKNWEKLADELKTPADALALLDKVLEDLGTDPVKNTFGKVQLDGAYADLTRIVGKAKDLAGKIPEEFKTLLKSLSQFKDSEPGVVSWGLDESKETELGSKVKLKISGKAKLQFTAAAKATIGGARSSGLLQLHADAGVKAGANGKLPIRWGSLETSANASVDVSLDYFYKPADPNAIYAIAVADRILHLPDPFDYDSVWTAFQGNRGLEGIVYVFRNKADAKANLVLSASGNLLDDVLADVKLTIGASASIDNSYTMSLRAVAAPQGAAGKRIEIVLGRTTESSAGINLGVEVKLDASKLIGRVREVLNKAVAKSDEVLGTITPYLTPGTWLREQAGTELTALAGKLIKDPALTGLRDALVDDIKSVLAEGTPDETAIASWLSDKLTDAIDNGAKEFTDKGEGLIDKLLARISGALPLPADLQATFAGKAKGELAPLVDKVSKALKDELGKFIALPDKEIRKALKKVNIEVSGKLDSIDKAFEPLRKLIDEYNRVLKLAKDFANDSARAKISASLKLEELWKWGAEEKIVGTFTGTEAADTFERLVTGNVDDLRGVLLRDRPTPGFELNTTASSSKRSAGRTSKQGFELVLFGFGESGSVLLDGNADILIDGDGNVQVDAKGELKKRFKTSTEEREVSFVDTFSLKLTKAADGTPLATRTIDVGVSIAHVDKELKLKELTGFIDSLAKAGLVATDTSATAATQYGMWAKDGKTIPADVSAKLKLAPAQIRALMHIGPGDRGTDGRLTKDVKKKLIERAVAVGEAHGENRANVRHGHEGIEDEHLGMERKSLAEFLYDRVLQAGTQNDIMSQYSIKDNDVDLREFISEYRRMLALIEIVQRLGDIYKAVPRVDGNSSPGAWSEKDYAREEHRLAESCSRWLHTGGGGFGIGDEVAAVTVTFLATVCDLVGITRTDPNADAVALSVAGTPPGASKRLEVPLTAPVVAALPG